MHEFIDRQVLVHPDLEDDPARNQGRIGTVANVVEENDEVFVDFSNGHFGIYDHSALLVLKPSSLLLEALSIYQMQLTASTQDTVRQIHFLQETGQREMIEEALQLAMKDRVMLYVSTISLQDWIDRGLSDHPDFDKGPIRSR